MKKLLAIMMSLLLTVSLAACGSAETGTLGTFNTEYFSISWSKAAIGSTLKMSILGPMDGEWNWTIEPADDETGEMPVSYSIKNKSDKVVIKFKKIADFEKEEGAVQADYETVLLGQKGEEYDSSTDLYLRLCFTSTEEVPLSLSVSEYHEPITYEPLDSADNYPLEKSGFTEDGTTILRIESMRDANWVVEKVDAKKISATVSADDEGRTLVYLRGKAKGDTDLVLLNKITGASYTVHCSVNLQDGVTATTESAVSEFYRVYITGTEHNYETQSIEKADGFEYLPEGMLVKASEVKIPEDAYVSEVSAYNADFSDEGTEALRAELSIEDVNGALEVSTAKNGLETLQNQYGFDEVEKEGKYEVNTEDITIGGVNVTCYSVEDSVICFWEKDGKTYCYEVMEKYNKTKDEILKEVEGMI